MVKSPASRAAVNEMSNEVQLLSSGNQLSGGCSPVCALEQMPVHAAHLQGCRRLSLPLKAIE